jgi:hypothetical protein
MKTCPCCKQQVKDFQASCPFCSTIFSKWQDQKTQTGQTQEQQDKLQETDALVVKQQFEKLEFFTGLETRNQYTIKNGDRDIIAYASEVSSFLLRWLLKGLCPYDLHITEPGSNRLIYKLVKPFRFYFHKIEVRNAHGQLIGSVQKNFSILSRQFTPSMTIGVEKSTRFLGPCFTPGPSTS